MSAVVSVMLCCWLNVASAKKNWYWLYLYKKTKWIQVLAELLHAFQFNIKTIVN